MTFTTLNTAPLNTAPFGGSSTVNYTFCVYTINQLTVRLFCSAVFV